MASTGMGKPPQYFTEPCRST